MANSWDNKAAQDLERHEENPDKARRNDDLLRDFKEKESLDARERSEEIRVAQETAVTYDLSPANTGAPRFSATCSRPPVLSLSSQTYVLSAKLRCLSGTDNQPFTIQQSGVIGTAWNEGEAYLFYAAERNPIGTGKTIEHGFLNKNCEDKSRPVGAENGFTTLRVGESVDRRVEIVLSWWLGLEVGKAFELLIPRAHIGWWEYGIMVWSQQSCWCMLAENGLYPVRLLG